MNEIFTLFLSLSVSGSIVALILFIVKLILKDRLSKTWHYYIWLVVIARLLIPYSPQVSIVGTWFDQAEAYLTNLSNQLNLVNQSEVLAQEVAASIPTTDTTDEFSQQITPMAENEFIQGKIAQKQKAVDYWSEIKQNCWLFWIVIALLLFVRKVTSYHNFLRFIKAGRHEVTKASVLHVLNDACVELGIKRPLALFTNKLATAPMLVGVFQPFVILPSLALSNQELHNIFIHELSHYKRLDIFYKWLTQIAVCIHWFNPLVYWISNEMNNACELSCDELILKRLSVEEKKQYGNTLIASLKLNGNYGDTIVSITLNEDARLLKERLGAIKMFRKRSKGAVIFSMAVTIFVICGATVTGAYASTGSRSSGMNTEERSVATMTPILLPTNDYTYLTEINAGEVKSEQVMFQNDSPNAFLYLELEDYSEPIGIKVFNTGTNNMVFSMLGATFANNGGIPGFVISGEGLYSVELSRSNEKATQRVVVYGASIENTTDYEDIILPKNKGEHFRTDTIEAVSDSARLIYSDDSGVTDDSNAESKKNIEAKVNVDSKENVKEIRQARNQKYDFYRSYDEACLDIENGYIFNMDKTFAEKAMPFVREATYRFVTNHANYLEICISTKNLIDEGLHERDRVPEANIKFEIISPEGDVVYSFLKQRKEIENATDSIVEVPIYPGEWNYKVSFTYQSDGINASNLKITAKYKEIYEDDIRWLKNFKLNNSADAF